MSADPTAMDSADSPEADPKGSEALQETPAAGKDQPVCLSGADTDMAKLTLAVGDKGAEPNQEQDPVPEPEQKPEPEPEPEAVEVDSDSSVEVIGSPRGKEALSNEKAAGEGEPAKGGDEIQAGKGAGGDSSLCATSSFAAEEPGKRKLLEEPEELEVELKKKAIDVEEGVKLEGRPDQKIFYGKDCANCICKRRNKQFALATRAILNFYEAPRRVSKEQFVCLECYDAALDMYEKYAGLLVAKQPLLKLFQPEETDCVALDSSDEEEEGKWEEKREFSVNTLKLIEDELEKTVKGVLGRVEIENQVTWSKTILEAKADRLEGEFELAAKEMAAVQRFADNMHSALYKTLPVVHQHQPALDLQPHMIGSLIPPAGEIERPPIQLGATYYAVKNKAIASWVSVKVTEFTESTAIGGNTMKSYKIRYLNTPYQMIKTVTAKHIAYSEPPRVRLTIGTRVIAYFDSTILTRGKDKGAVPSAFYPGIIAEPLKQANRYRYLVFYDDGYTQYVQHCDVRLVCQASEKVWEDVHPASRDFIQKYVEKYSVDRPMVQCTRGQSMNTESNGTWHYARVVDIDCSLVLMQFEADKSRMEWIYRGSLRLGPVFKETQNAMGATGYHARVPRRTEPFIRYTKEMETSNMQVDQQMRAIARKSSSALAGSVSFHPPAAGTSAAGGASTAVSAASVSAAGSTAASRAAPVKHLNNSTIYVDDENRPKGHVVYFTAKRNLPPKMFRRHKCNPNCLFKIVHRLDSYSPLAKPLLSGWERQVMRQRTKKNVVYRGPCGKSLRNLAEVHTYLRATENVLNVDNFDFTPDLRCLAEYSIDATIVKDADISKGQEKMAIPLVNYYDNTLPPPCTYAKQRIPTEGVPLNLDEEFLVGCDCEDDCSDKSKCSCWQLTVAGVKYCNPKKPIEEIGYQYKRLHEHVPTGIYECNSRCKCKKNCLNRVVQHSLEMKLQVFKTSNRGWGLRCVNDIPKGAFICIYAGHLLTETMANEGGQDAGDEYFADLDYIEVAEQLKEGYESEAEPEEPEPEEDVYRPSAEDDDDFRPNSYYQHKLRSTRSSIGSAGPNPEQDSQERAVINFNPNADLDETVRENSVRRLFGKDEAPYIMDAKTTGNLGRYFNHSCNPNLFVQNVFVDTHDLRFPWVAFFSASHIRSGTELTWNYNYEVGVVPGKVLYCQCGAPNCRIRLL